MSYEIDFSARYRKRPALSQSDMARMSGAKGPSERETACARRTGHVLSVRGGRIVCVECGAEWRDEGF